MQEGMLHTLVWYGAICIILLLLEADEFVASLATRCTVPGWQHELA